jgi:hypothetical protein
MEEEHSRRFCLPHLPPGEYINSCEPPSRGVTRGVEDDFT